MGITQIPDIFTISDPETALKIQFDFPESLHTVNMDRAYWQFEAYARKIDADFSRLFSAAEFSRNSFESAFITRQAEIETNWLRLREISPEKMTRAINDFTRQTMLAYLTQISK